MARKTSENSCMVNACMAVHTDSRELDIPKPEMFARSSLNR